MSHDALACSCYNNKIYSKKFINNRNLFFTILDTGKCKVKAPSVLVSEEGPVSTSKRVPCGCILFREGTLCPHIAEGTKALGDVPSTLN
jgi:hypothetical protein